MHFRQILYFAVDIRFKKWKMKKEKKKKRQEAIKFVF